MLTTFQRRSSRRSSWSLSALAHLVNVHLLLLQSLAVNNESRTLLLQECEGSGCDDASVSSICCVCGWVHCACMAFCYSIIRAGWRSIFFTAAATGLCICAYTLGPSATPLHLQIHTKLTPTHSFHSHNHHQITRLACTNSLAQGRGERNGKTHAVSIAQCEPPECGTWACVPYAADNTEALGVLHSVSITCEEVLEHGEASAARAPGQRVFKTGSCSAIYILSPSPASSSTPPTSAPSHSTSSLSASASPSAAPGKCASLAEGSAKCLIDENERQKDVLADTESAVPTFGGGGGSRMKTAVYSIAVSMSVCVCVCMSVCVYVYA